MEMYAYIPIFMMEICAYIPIFVMEMCADIPIFMMEICATDLSAFYLPKVMCLFQFC